MLTVLMVAACAGLERRPPATAGMELPYGFYGFDPSSDRMRPVEAAMAGEGLELVFRVVSGTIMGAPGGRPSWSVPVLPGGTFELPLPGAMDVPAERLASAPLEIEPADTRIARLATFHAYPEYGMFLGGGCFVDTRSGDYLLLVYFSNPARLSGSARGPAGTYEYEVTVERPGWAWLAVRERDVGSYRVRPYAGPADAIEFGVLLPPAMIGGA